jgi:hypothetical protein
MEVAKMKYPATLMVRSRLSFLVMAHSVQSGVAAIYRMASVLIRLVCLPFHLLFGVMQFFVLLGHSVVRWVFSFCLATLTAAVLAAVLFGMLRTLLHPWFS